MFRHEPKPLLSFEAVLSSQLDGSVSYPTMKKLLRTLKSSTDLPYPRPRVSTLSQRLQLSQSASRNADLKLSQTIHKARSMTLTQSPSLWVTGSGQGANRYSGDNPRGEISRLRRKRRSSKRAASDTPQAQRKVTLDNNNSENPVSQEVENINICLFPSNNDVDEQEQEHEQGRDAGELEEKNKCYDKRPAANNSTAEEVGEHVNLKLNSLATKCEEGKVVTWHDLREEIACDKRLAQFCQFVDSLFNIEDTLATGPTTLDGCNVPFCVYYSNLFWRKTWSDFHLTVSSMAT